MLFNSVFLILGARRQFLCLPLWPPGQTLGLVVGGSPPGKGMVRGVSDAASETPEPQQLSGRSSSRTYEQMPYRARVCFPS